METTWLPSFYFNDRLDTMMATPIDEDTEVSAGQKFPEEVTAILERLYRRGMTGWGKDHAGDLDIATGSTSLTLSQVKVCT